MGLSLATKKLGGTDQAFAWLLHMSGTTLATGGQVSLGNGNESPLYLSATGVGIKSAGGFVATLVSQATAARTVNLEDFAGSLYPEKRVYLGTTKASTSTTPSAIASFGFTPEINATYEVILELLATSAATTTGVQLTLTGPASGAAITLVQDNAPLSINAIGGTYAATSSPVATTAFGIVLRGILTTGSAVSADIGLSLATEINASQVQILAGSKMTFRRRA
jgi:hypothetical protein